MKKKAILLLTIASVITALLFGFFSIQNQSAIHIINPVTEDISVNQVGYAPEAVKIAYTTNRSKTFSLVEADNQQEVFSEDITKKVLDKATAKEVYILDFSSFQKPGRYKLKISNGIYSVPFYISNDVYKEIFTTTMRSYELQRCGVPIEDPVSHVSHEACHIKPAVLNDDQSKTLDVSGGWHDAGDFGKYIPSAGITVGQLLLAHQLAPETIKETVLEIPEHKKNMPDLLTEIRVELDWMLKMQRKDGGVYHKVSTDEFPGMISPEEDTEQQYVYNVTTASTAIFAAAMAKASIVFQEYDEEYAKQTLQAAVKAWNFVSTTKPILNVPNDHIGAYQTKSDRDERLWAATELYLATQDPIYRSYIKEHFSTVIDDGNTLGSLNWDNVQNMVLFDLTLAPDMGWNIQRKAKELVVNNAEHLVQQSQKSSYGSTLQPSEYIWASAKAHAAYGLNLAIAHHMKPDSVYVNTMISQMNWVLGSNPLSKSFATGLGQHSVHSPHNRYVVASGTLIPGLLVGGPNTKTTDDIAPSGLGPLSYVDDSRSYATNENAIDYNAPFIVLAAYLHEVQ